MFQLDLLLIGSGKSETGHARRSQNLGKTGAVTERIGRPSHRWHASEGRSKVILRHRKMTRQNFRGRKIRIGLDVGSSDHIPAAFLDELLDPGKRLGIVFLNVLVNGSFSPNESQLGILVHEIDDRPDRGDSFIQTLPPIPEPNGIEMSIGQQMENDFFHDIFRTRPC